MRRGIVFTCVLAGGLLGFVLTPKIYAATFMIYEPADPSLWRCQLSPVQPPFVVSVARHVARYLDKAAAAMGRTNVVLEQGLDKLIEQQSK